MLKYAIFYTCKFIFWGGFIPQLHRCIPQKGGWDTGVAPSGQTVGCLLRTPVTAKPAKLFLTKGEFSELTSIEKCTLAFVLNFHKHFSSQNFLCHHFSKSNLKPNQSLPLLKTPPLFNLIYLIKF